MRQLVGGLACAGLVLALAACNSEGEGYVEIKTVPSYARLPVLYLDLEKVEPGKNGVMVLRQRVGTAKLQVDGSAGKTALCEVVVKRNRITTVTVSALDRPPRCQCARTATSDVQAGRTCLS